ncbi:hypothetical protein [uncultured Campylobacter sp.]|uniref:hypothetical protein n=1 Tax=uncultured Campylobacter sp. TaxID=218934 RepID=UPI0028E7E5EA|nr:hypothetical protein [uncultured Campylobacter sp.]
MGYRKKAGEVSKQISDKGVEIMQKKLAKRSDDEIRELVKKCPDNKLIAQEAQRRGIY